MDVTGWPAAVLIGAPMLLLLVTMAYCVATGGRAKPRLVPREIATGRYGVPVPDRRPLAASAPGRVAEPPPPPPIALDDLLSAIAAAETSGDDARLAGLYIGLARHYASTGRADDAAEVLRKSIRISSRLGLKPEHGAARLELGDIARAGGDLTTACEHWQIARGLFFELKHTRDLDAAEARMQKSGCPTDWVLNDF